MPCLICRSKVPRQAEWFSTKITDTSTGLAESFGALCSWDCLGKWLQRNTKMIDPTERERHAMEAASDAAGAYLENLGNADLATLAPEQWDHLLWTIAGAYAHHLNAECEKEEAVSASFLAGEYLESIGKYDLSSLSKEEWMNFVEVVCGAWSAASLQDAGEEAPF